MMLYKLLLIYFAAYAIVIHCDDCVFNLKHKEKHLQFDLTRFEDLQKVNFTNSNDMYLNIKLCKSNKRVWKCDGINSKICLIKNKKYFTESDIGSKIKEAKLDFKDQLILSLEGNTICEKNQKYSTDLTFVCNKNMIGNKADYKLNVNHCKYIIELTSAVGCPIDDLDIRNICNVSIPHINFEFNLNPLRRLTNNYLVENQNRKFELNICGRLTDNNKCGGNITTICDITDIRNPKVYAVGKYANDELLYDTNSKSLKLIQHERASKNKKGRRIELIFKCDENIVPENTKPTFLNEENYHGKKISPNIAYFEVATSAVCIPRMVSCEVITNYTARFNLKPLHKRVDNWKIINENNGGIFYLNICGYLNVYDRQIPTSCKVGGKTSACYVDSSGKGISIGSTQIGPYYNGNSIIINYTDGDNCSNFLKWSTVINLTCSGESILIHESTNFTLCIHVFNWKTPKACEILFERKDQCMVTHPQYSHIVYNVSNLKNQTFKKEIEDNASFRFSICSPLQEPCNGILDSAACWSMDGNELNIGLFTEQIVFDNGSIYISMHGEKCVNNEQGPNSYTIVRFVCDYLDSKWIDFKKDFDECTFEFTIYTKHACTQPLKINCTVDDKLGNVFDLSKLTKFSSNYEITTSQKTTIILNVCHSVINNDINAVNCQFNSGVCLVDHNNLLYSDRYKNLGDVKKSPYKIGNKIILEMIDGFYNGHKVSSVIEFICSNQNNGPILTVEENYKYIFQWFTPLVCSNRQHIKKREIIKNDSTLKSTISIDGLSYTTYICPKNKNDVNCNSEISVNNEFPHGRTIILFVNEQKNVYTLHNNLYFNHNSNITCDEDKNTTVQIRFMFYCGYELQLPTIQKHHCTTTVLSINPEMCDEKLECNVSLYDLTPIKGTHIVNINGIKYFINICIPGTKGIGGIMQVNNISYNIGYQVTPIKSYVQDIVEIDFKNGDKCLDSTSKLSKTRQYSTKITLLCDITETEEKPILKVSGNNCTLQFEWKTSLVCSRKLVVEFDKDMCAATIKRPSQNVKNNTIIDFNNILIINNLTDYSTKTNYQVNLCNGTVILNGTTVFGNMILEYDLSKKQLLANFQNKNDKHFKNVVIIVACSKSTEDLSIFNVIATDNGVRIGTYSKGICCMDFNDHTNEEICKTYHLIPISTTTTVENQLSVYSPYSENNKSFESSLKINLEITKKEELILSTTEQIDESMTLIVTELKHIEHSSQQIYSIPTMKKEVVSGSSFYIEIVLMVLVIILLTWIYRWKLLKEIRKVYYTLPFAKRRRGSYNHNLM
ncbi:cation-independent mannose-6-phosphate receptor [Rhopalosiphum padi]|uniref:cation-independent mannose-6-phosphate receptor n=1 Tax=Rhopalosiphum padi TaxID=40932 RepID=UPI00298EA519|nr:cation-independent mannose-6-phosphate receptor [Rhopalosiphum padi]XP_060841060.1 cation-independent mannose-6-phosphate receptor [Rhopalosiphum padi]